MKQYDLVIVGAGPAGMTAGLYAARAKLDCALVERLSPGGQVLRTHWVENWPGDPDGVEGWDLVERMRRHAEKFGLVSQNAQLDRLRLEGGRKILETSAGTMSAKAVVLALGAEPRKLGVPGEDLLTGKGVSYCATCDGPFFRDQVVACVGGGDTAAEEALFLTRFAKKVYLIHRRDQLRAAGCLVDRVMDEPKIEVLWHNTVVSVQGENQVEGITLSDTRDATRRTLDEVTGVFIFVGTTPQTQAVRDVVATDQLGFIKVDVNMATNVPGVFAAGDCCSQILRQIVVAAGNGATAAFAAQRYLEEKHE